MCIWIIKCKNYVMRDKNIKDKRNKYLKVSNIKTITSGRKLKVRLNP